MQYVDHQCLSQPSNYPQALNEDMVCYITILMGLLSHTPVVSDLVFRSADFGSGSIVNPADYGLLVELRIGPVGHCACSVLLNIVPTRDSPIDHCVGSSVP